MKTTSELFGDLAQDAPPSTVDVAGIVRKQKRRRLGLRLAGPAALLAAAGVVGALALQPAAPVAGPAQAPPAAPTLPGFALAAADSATAAHLRAAFDAAVHRVAPAATWFSEGDTLGQTTPPGQPPIMVGDTGDRLFLGTGGIEADGRRGSVQLRVDGKLTCDAACAAAGKGPGPSGLLACPPTGSEASTCTTGSTAGRRWLRLTWPVGPKGRLEYDYRVGLGNGRVLVLDHDNMVATDSGKYVPAQRTTPLTPVQLTAILNDIASQVRP